jgi:hypothetical protein
VNRRLDEIEDLASCCSPIQGRVDRPNRLR